MIPVVKPAAPDVLLKRGTKATQELCAAYESAPADYNGGACIFEFDSSLYAARAVKDALRKAQHDKCAFCESIFKNTGYGDVEHFRPKAGYKQKAADELRRPGYYWLAYAWDNLFYSCQLCNQQFKRNLFPLKDGRRRARSHKHDLTREEPLLVNPSRQEPSLYLGFREEYVYAVGDCREGNATIEVLGLNREELAEVRRNRLAILKQLVQLRELLREKITKTRTAEYLEQLRTLEEMIRLSKSAAGEFAAMSRAFLDAPTSVSGGS